jgi:beta-N-acetylhexosaminidase
MKTNRRLSHAIALLKYGAAGLGLCLLLFWAWHLKHPIMFFLRPVETPLLLALALCGIVWAVYRHQKTAWFASRQRWQLMLVGSLLLFGLTTFGELEFQYQRRQVLNAEGAIHRLGQHFIIGFTDWSVLDELAGKGLIGGIYLGSRNVAGLSVAAVSARISRLQALRAVAGLPPLIVAADQEGGKIEHLSPLLPSMPPLASLAHLEGEAAQAAAYAYGKKQGQGLHNLGVNLNLSPVVDLKPARPIAVGDTHTLISQRAIAADPAIVMRVAQSYSQGLRAAGIQATLKHFPGLGRVRTDTHHSTARIDAEPTALAKD